MKKFFQKGKIFSKILYLFFLLLLALFLDFFLYALTSACPGCTSFSQWLAAPQALSGPILAALAALVFPKKIS